MLRRLTGLLDIQSMVREPTEPEWQNMLHYAKLIRVFTHSPYGVLTQAIDSSVLYAMFSFAENTLFSNLRVLEWPISGISENSFSYLTNFIGPSLECITLRYSFQAGKIVLDNLRICQSLQKVDIKYISTEPGATASLKQVLLQSPRLHTLRLAFPIEPFHVTILSSLDGLRLLDIVLSKRSEWSNQSPSKFIFSRLEQLYLRFDSIQRAIDFLTVASFPCLISITLELQDEEPPHPLQVEKLAACLSSHSSKNMLEDIYITSECTGGPWNNEYAIRPSTLAPFLSLPNIQRFDIDANWCYDLDNGCLRAMAMAWPNLGYLGLDAYGSWPPSADCGIDLAGLLPIVKHCPDITEIQCHIEGAAPSVGDSDDEDDETDVSSDTLAHLSVGYSRVPSVEDAAVFLSKLCPEVDHITSWDSFPDRRDWDSVASWANRLTAIRRKERIRAHDEYCDDSDCSHDMD